MKNTLIAFSFSLIGIFTAGHASAQNKSIRAESVSDGSITIDGNANEQEWIKAETATGFTEWDPTPGQKPENSTSVKIIYDETAIYLLAVMHETNPEDISTQLTERDDPGQADNFGLIFDPYGDDALSYCFGITAAGVQFDYKLMENIDDYSWNSVWKSAVKINDTAWIAEIEIPYSALRFPKSKQTLRKINFVRHINDGRRHLSWSPIDPTADNTNAYNGILENLQIENPPIRLSISPYLSAYYLHRSDLAGGSRSLKGGADLKYGISESFTLDMMLIPDFGQVRSDDQTLNLSPYETYYDEKRSFFLEGTELFEKGNIFYSRRIGSIPEKFYSAKENLKAHEILTFNPSTVQLLNATKISGKTKGGSSIGVLNAISMQSFAEAKDTLTNETRQISTQDFTNYNVTAFQQSLPNNSFVSLTNTNMLTPGDDFSANVTATDFKAAEKSKTYAIFGRAAYSRNQIKSDSINTGYFYDFSFEKIKGNLKFAVETKTENDSYDPNYMGFLQRNNAIINSANISYNYYNPSERWLRINPRYTIQHGMNYLPRHHSYVYNELHVYALTKNHLSLWISSGFDLTDNYNFNETRTEERYFRSENSRNFTYGISSNYAKELAIDYNGNGWNSADNIQYGYFQEIAPRWRPAESVMLIWRSSYNYNKSYNYAYHSGSDIIFGLRSRVDIRNELDGKLIFNKRSSVSLRLRHTRSTVEYDGAFLLEENGLLSKHSAEIDPLEYGAFNAYLIYQLEFAPGSFLSLAWQNDILHSDNYISPNYMAGLSNTFEDNVADNTFSIKILMYIDYFTNIRKLKNRQKKSDTK